MASSTAAPITTGVRQVSCKTADDQQIPVELDVLRLSHTFTEMYDLLDIKDNEDFPGIFPVGNIESRVLVRVLDWCQEHKGQADPIVEKDLLTQEEKWFAFTDFEREYLSVPVPELLELIEAANYLEIRSLYEYGCQAIAELIKGKQPFEVRQILHQSAKPVEAADWLGIRSLIEYGRQAIATLVWWKRPSEVCQVVPQADLSAKDIDEIFSRCPWLGSKAKFQDQFVDVQEPLYIPAEVLVSIFQKLPRADLERFQLISRYFRNVIVKSSELELSEKRGPLRPMDVTLLAKRWGDHVVTPVDSNSSVICPNGDSIGECLSEFCTVRKMEIRNGHGVMSSELLASLAPLKPAWKNAIVDVPLSCVSSKDDFDFAFTELFICKEIQIYGNGRFDPQPFLRLPAFLHCNRLNIHALHHSVDVNDLVEWVESEKPKQWDEPTYLEVDSGRVIGGTAALVDALKAAFMHATRPNTYTIRIETWRRNPMHREQHDNETTNEQLTIKSVMTGYPYFYEYYISVERKHLD